jgi:Lipocalin-like domain
MKMIRFAILVAVVPLIAVSQARAADKTDREKLIGAWRLASIAGPDGKPVTTGLPIGMLIYTRDGHVSVQLMYPKSAGALSNEYVHNGYEASFGSYDVNDASHTVTHHVLGSNTGDLLVGKDLPRAYRFSADGHLILKSTRPDEHWSVRWEHY